VLQSAKSRKLFVLGAAGIFLTMFFSELDSRNVLVEPASARGLVCKNLATCPATWGHAIDVPEMVLMALLLPIQVEVIAKQSMKPFSHVVATLFDRAPEEMSGPYLCSDEML